MNFLLSYASYAELQVDLVMDYLLSFCLWRTFETEWGFYFSVEVEIAAVSYQQLSSHITYGQVAKKQGSVLSAC